MAKARGWKVVRVHIDNDISAYSGKVRPGYRQLLEDISAGTVRAVAVWHLDRLHRQPKELEAFIDLVERHGVALASVTGEHDLATPEGRLHARILGAVARMESEHKSRRIRRKMLELAKAGKPHGGGNRPFGYADDRVTILPDEAAIIQEAADRVLAGETLRAVCMDFNRRGFTTSSGAPWSGLAIKRVLINPRTAGLSAHRDAGVVDAIWPGILTVQQHESVRAFLTNPSRRTGAGAPRRYLLSGLLRCGECGDRMVATPPRLNRGAAYLCSPRPERGCGKVLIVAQRAEPYIVDAVLTVLNDPRLTQLDAPAENAGRVLRDLAADRTQLEELASLYAARKVTAAEWLRARDEIEARITAGEQLIVERAVDDGARRFAGQGEDLRAIWPSLSIDEQRTILASVLDRVVVHRVGKRRSHFDPSRLEAIWRL